MGKDRSWKHHFCMPPFSIEGLDLKFFYTSQWDDYFRCMPTFYAIYRTLVAIFFVTSLILSGVIKNYSDGPKWLIMLTNWSFLILTCDTLVQAAVVLYGARQRFRTPNLDWATHDTKLPWYIKVEWVLTDIATGSGFLVTILFWTLLYNAGKILVPMTFITHAVNSSYILINIFISGIPLRFSHLIFLLIYAIVYFSFTAAYQLGFDQTAIYVPLDWANPGQAVLNFFLYGMCGTTMIWTMVLLLTELRQSIYRHTNKRSHYEAMPGETS